MEIYFILRHFLFTLLTLTIVISVQGQQDTLFATNLKLFDNKRYEDIKGSPYLFSDWVKADIIRRDSFKFRDVMLNYNGDTHEFEVLQDGRYIELEQLWYKRIEVDPAKNKGVVEVDDKVVFLQGFHHEYVDRFALLAYEGEHVYLIKDFSAVLSEKKVQNVGKAIEFKRFTPRVKYALYHQGKITSIKLKKEEILNVLGHEKTAEDFLKANKIKKTNSEEKVIMLLKYLDDQIGLQTG